MSHFSDGVSAYKSGDYHRAINEFHAAVEENDQDHKAWNALGTALSKSGDYEGAATCFENALILAPDNATYLKNQDRNNAKRGSAEDEIELDDEPPIKRRSIKVEEPLGLGVTICVVIGFLFGIVSAIIALFFGGLASAFGASGTDFIIGRAWIGIFLTFVGLPCPFVKHKKYSMLILALTGLMILFIMGLFGLITGVLYLLASFLLYRKIGLDIPYFIDFSNDKFKKGLYSLVIFFVVVISASGMSMNSTKDSDNSGLTSFSTGNTKSAYSSPDQTYSSTQTSSNAQHPSDDDCRYFKIVVLGGLDLQNKLQSYSEDMSLYIATDRSKGLNAAIGARDTLNGLKREIQLLNVGSSNQKSKDLYLKGIDTFLEIYNLCIEIFSIDPNQITSSQTEDLSLRMKDVSPKVKLGLEELASGIKAADAQSGAQCFIDKKISSEELLDASNDIKNKDVQLSQVTNPVEVTQTGPINDPNGLVAVQPKTESYSANSLYESEQRNSLDFQNTPSSEYDFSQVTHATFMVAGKNWNSDAQNDGVGVYPDLKDGSDATVKWSGATLPVDVEIWTTKMNKQYKYEKDRLVYSGSGTITSWEDGNFLMKGGIRVAFSQMNVPSGASYGQTFVKVHLPDQRIIESKFDYTPLTP